MSSRTCFLESGSQVINLLGGEEKNQTLKLSLFHMHIRNLYSYSSFHSESKTWYIFGTLIYNLRSNKFIIYKSQTTLPSCSKIKFAINYFILHFQDIAFINPANVVFVYLLVSVLAKVCFEMKPHAGVSAPMKLR